MSQILDGEIYGKEILNGFPTNGSLLYCREGIIDGEVNVPGELVNGVADIGATCVTFNITDPAFWVATDAPWGGTAWIVGVNPTFTVKGKWAEGFRPSQVRIIATPIAQVYDDFQFEVRDNSANRIAYNDSYEGLWLPITFGANDLGDIRITDFNGANFDPNATFTIIEFQL